jgi:uncharacterized membrane protein YgdD (TMEM256/DUF423 family)
MKHLVMTGGIFGFLGVAIGAFGAHALKAVLAANEMTQTFQTGVQYHLTHALALLLVSALYPHLKPNRGLRTVGWLFTAGILLFSGSLYALAITNIKILGAITPLGGVCFLAGWFLLIATASRQTNSHEE